jgi:signal transduction histidine kinase
VDETARDHVVKEIQNGKKIVGEEHLFRKKNGDIVIGLFSAAMIFLDNEWCILSSIGDITEIRRVEAEREKLQAQFNQAQKMESVGRLAGGVAHDFNNMLSIIHGYTGMAMDELDPQSPIYADLEEVRKAADRSANLTRQLLAFARRQAAAPIMLDVNETVESMIKMLKRLIGENIELCWKPGDGVWVLKIDPSQVDQILANLCVNARDAIDGVGKLTISTENVAIDAADCENRPEFVPGEYVMIIFEDTGSGMDKETLSNIFEPFFTTKAVGEGTGLGLATVYGIVRQNYGFIDVYSEPGSGTIFKIYLPKHHCEIDMILNADSRKSATSGHETILLVEDDQSVLRMTAKMIERIGYTVVSAATPGKAIQLAKEHAGRIHLLMTDVIMPGMNGLALSREIMSIHPNLKLLFVSGYTADIIARHGVLEKGLHFIEKPLSRKVLADKLREVFEG